MCRRGLLCMRIGVGGANQFVCIMAVIFMSLQQNYAGHDSDLLKTSLTKSLHNYSHVRLYF